MIAYEIQLRYVIRDKIREKKSIQDQIQSEIKSERQFFFRQKFIPKKKKKKISDFVSLSRTLSWNSSVPF